MNVVILAGGLGTRISEYTQEIPKPMIPIGGTPIIEHIMQHYAKFNHKDFYLALGYKSTVVKQYFKDYHIHNSDFKINLKTGKLESLNSKNIDLNINLIDTGLHTMTGGRVKRLKDYLKKEPFLLTYGDGLANVNIDELLDFHKNHKKMVTCTAVRPIARFGELNINNKSVYKFTEKPQTGSSWINGGYFVVNPEFLDLIKDDETVLEKEPLEEAAKLGELMAFEHKGFWQCMDTRRDKDYLEELYRSGSAPWVS